MMTLRANQIPLTRTDGTKDARARATLMLLGIVAVYCAAIGGLAVLAPHAFYRHVVGVDRLGPFNEHLTSDVGGLYLGFAVMFVWAVVQPEIALIRAACTAFALTQTIHFIYHLFHLAPLTGSEVAEQTAGLLPLVIVPCIVILLARRERPRRKDPIGTI